MTKSSHPQISFNNVPVSRANFQKHLGIFLDEKLSFNHHIKEENDQNNKRLNRILPQYSLLTIYKSYVWPHLNYGNILS